MLTRLNSRSILVLSFNKVPKAVCTFLSSLGNHVSLKSASQRSIEYPRSTKSLPRRAYCRRSSRWIGFEEWECWHPVSTWLTRPRARYTWSTSVMSQWLSRPSCINWTHSTIPFSSSLSTKLRHLLRPCTQVIVFMEIWPLQTWWSSPDFPSISRCLVSRADSQSRKSSTAVILATL